MLQDPLEGLAGIQRRHFGSVDDFLTPTCLKKEFINSKKLRNREKLVNCKLSG
jgi:hypothetical protein